MVWAGEEELHSMVSSLKVRGLLGRRTLSESGTGIFRRNTCLGTRTPSAGCEANGDECSIVSRQRVPRIV